MKLLWQKLLHFLPARHTTHPQRRTAPKVLFLVTSSQIGGMQRVVRSLAAGLERKSWSTPGVMPIGPQSKIVSDWFLAEGVHVVPDARLVDAAASHSWRTALSLLRLLRSEAPEVVSIHYGDSFISLWDALALWLSRRPMVVVTIHQARPWSSRFQRKRILTGLSSRLVDCVIAVSKAAYDVEVAAGVPRSRLVTVQNGISLSEACADRTNLRVKYGIPTENFVISCMARLIPEKGVHKLLQAVSQIHRDVPNLTVLIAGDGQCRTHLEDTARESRLPVLFLGQVDNVADVLMASDVFVLPTEMEGFPLSFMEAAMSGIPSIATRVGGVPEVVVDGKTGILVDVGDIAALKSAIVRLIDDADFRSVLGRAAKARALELFSEERMVDRYHRLLGIHNKSQ